MQNKIYLIILAIFLCACSSGISFQSGSDKDITPAKQQGRSKTEVNDTQALVSEKDLENVTIPENKQKENTLPEVEKAVVVPKKVLHPGDTFGVEASGRDADGDEVVLLYEWMVNEEPAGNASQLEVPLKRGDKFSVKITPFDGKDYGDYVLLDRTTVNMPPVIIDNAEADFDGKTYLYQLKAQDPDGDELSYFLKKAPDGMTITPSTGLIVWDVPQEFVGVAKVFVVVEDGNGGKSHYDMNITIRSEETSS